jgi:hypothetical protein
MNNKKTGDAAFPRMSHTNCFDVMLPEQDGMTLRDYFAAKAMQACFVDDTNVYGTARLAYRIADAMLEARKDEK